MQARSLLVLFPSVAHARPSARCARDSCGTQGVALRGFRLSFNRDVTDIAPGTAVVYTRVHLMCALESTCR